VEYKAATNLSVLEAATAVAWEKIAVKTVEAATLRADLAALRFEEEETMALYKSSLAHIQAQQEHTEAMLSEQTAWKEQIAAAHARVASREQEVAELAQNVDDLKMHLESREQISKASRAKQKELQEGKLVMVGAPPTSPTKERGSRGKKKK
jgi:uncharacterized protein YoxC